MGDGVGSDEPTAVDTVVAGGWLLTMNPQREMYRAGAVAIDGGVIVEVGQRADLLARYHPRRLIDAPDGVITPGLVNGHRHLLCCAKGAMPEGGQTLDALRQFIYPSFAALTEQDMYVHAQHAAAEMIRFGTTLFEEPGVSHLDAVLEALASSGIRARTGPWTWDQAGPAGAADLPDWLRMDAKAALRRLADGVERVRKFGHPRIRDAVTIEGVGTCSDELNRGAAELARDAESLFVLHKSTSEREVELELATFGHRPVEHMHEIGALHERTLLNHMTSLDDRDVRYVADAGARISQNPSSALKLAKGTTQTGKWPELLAAGVPMALGTDAENVSNHQDICRSMQLAALLPRDARRDPRAVTAEQAVEMATISGATALWMDDVTGSLEARQAGRPGRVRHRGLRLAAAAQPGGQSGLRGDRALGRHRPGRRRRAARPQEADPRGRGRAARAGRADQPAGPARDRHRPPAAVAGPVTRTRPRPAGFRVSGT